MVPCPPNNFARTVIFLSFSVIMRSITSLFSGWPFTLTSYVTKTICCPSGDRCGNQIILFAKRDLFLLASIRAHPPDLHVPGAFGVEVNVLAVRRVFRAIVQSLGGRQLFLFAARRRNGVDVELTIPLADESQRLSVRRPAMPVR